jgi:hypothetical protein
MAAVDLYGGDAERIRNQYRTSLGRDASDDEVSGWLTGSYGGGGVDQWAQQIASSHEAQQRNPQPQAPQTFGSQTPPSNPETNYAMNQPAAPQDDPWARARAGIENTYQQHLGRSAGAEDIEKWLSGGYGYGSGLQDYDKYIAAIMGSPEARAYRPQNTNTSGYQNLEFWQSQGVPAIDIFDPTTGQLKQGWQRTGRGYERVGGAGAGAASTGAGAAGNYPAPQGGNYQGWFQTLTQGKPPSPQSLRELEPVLNQYGIRVGPRNARGWSDTIILPDGTVLDVIEAATENGGKAWSWFTPGPHSGNAGGIGGVGLPSSQYSDPHTKLLEELMLARIASLQGGNDPALQQLMQFLQQRFADLQTPGRTGAEQEVIRTQALDPLERDRNAARQRLTERLAARGITQESGVFQQLMAELDKEFDGLRTTTQSALTTDELNRREGRLNQAGSMATSLYEIPQSRAREALGYAGSLADLGPQRLQLAMQAAGMGGSPNSNFANLMQLANLNQNSALLNQQNSGQLWQGLGSIAAILAGAGR